LLAHNLPDTLKREEGGRVVETLERDDKWAAQTPQMFRIGMLREAILRAQADGHDLTDEASAIEWLGYAPKLVQGSLRNFKVTYPEDFDLAEAILSRPAAA
jgi:2-C-methyl-D-erythritol 4-phosphate cytidylyltransferase